MNGSSDTLDEGLTTRPQRTAGPTAAYGKSPDPVPRRPALLIFSGLATLFCAGVVAQVFLAGLGLLVDPSYLRWHTTFVHLLEGLLLVLLVLGVSARAGWHSVALVLGLYLLIGAQYAFIHGLSGPFRALHAVNSFALFVIAWQLAKDAATRGWGLRHNAGQRLQARVNFFVATAVLLVAVASVAVAGTLGEDPGTNSGVLQGSDTTVADEEQRSVAGAAVFAANCSGCHGERGQGRVGPALAGNDGLADRAMVVERVSRGSGIMPAFEGSLSSAQIEAVVDYLRSSWGNDFR